MIQRGLMMLPDEHAKETLASVRAQIKAQNAHIDLPGNN
jgi:hypothetical protein